MWAGGKKKLLKHYANMWPSKHYKTYIEPFFGGGAVYGWLQGNQHGEYDNFQINDVNIELMGMLADLRDNTDLFLEELDTLSKEYLTIDGKENRKKYFYAKQKEYWDAPNPRLLFFLMRLAFNGIWQTCNDAHGLFGTPAGLLNHKNRDAIYKPNVLKEWATALKHTTVSSVSYDEITFDPTDALIYLDPPYRDSFTTYGTIFGDEEQKKLIEWALEQKRLGATVLLANRYVEGDTFFEDLLPEATFYPIDVVYTAGRRKRLENGFAAKPAREFIAKL